jgi:MYXO-CTERM domain-containing protein
MKSSFVFLAALLIALSASRSGAQTLNWGSAAFSDLVDSHGDVLDSAFVFELGTFELGFTPTEDNFDNWFENWLIFDTADYNAGNGVFTSVVHVQDVANYESLFEGMQAYIWVRNGTTPGPETEGFLATKTLATTTGTWVFPDLDPGCCPNGEVTQWSISQLGTEPPVWGNQGGIPGGGDYPDNGTYDLQTHVVPEPGACLLGLAGLAFALFRRRRTDFRFD